MTNVHQLVALQRIAAYSAEVRGHKLGEWRTGDNFAMASCVRCGAALQVHFPALQPEIDGQAIEHFCGERAATERAA